jgi:predicted DNA-binding transcriptional regulator AlpA
MMTDESDDVFLTIPEAAALLRVKRRTLDNYRWQKRGPPYRRHGGRIVYSRKELLEWSEQHRTRTRAPDKSRESPHARSGDTGIEPARRHLPESERSDAALERQS